MSREVLGLAAAVRTLCGEENLRKMVAAEGEALWKDLLAKSVTC